MRLLCFLAAVCAGFPLFAAAPATERLYLSGRDSADAVSWEFRCSAGAKSGVWSTIPVPSNWEMHGFGTLSYHSLTPSESGEYRHRFTVPAEWRERRIKLVFDGVMTDTRVQVNGQPAGPMHQGGFYRFSYDVTDKIKFDGENLLEVAVDETSANEGVNKAERTGDYWNFGGIYRPVWLEAAPVQAIERVAIDARADGAFALDAFLEGRGDAAQVEVRVVDALGREVAPAWRADIADTKTRVTGRVNAPQLWSAESPALYTAETRLLAKDGTVRHALRTRFGFRTFEVRAGDGFYLNGRRIVLQGANRHSFNAETGRSLSEADHREDIRLMKEMNFTAVRMSHYPPDERFLELCDEEGLYVIDELAGWQKSYDTEVGRQLVEAMIKRDVNHPSVLLWDNGNEGGWNTDLDAEFAQWDPQRRAVLHPWATFSGVNTAHYRPFSQLATLVQGLEIPRGAKSDAPPVEHPQPLIYLPTEFLHGLYDGGIGAGMEDYWTLMRSGKTFGGGFVWALVDEGVLRPDTGEIDVKGNQGPDGILGPRREREASFYTLKELWSPLVVHERTLPQEFAGTLSLENRYSFTDASACRFVWQLRRLPEPGATNAVTLASGVTTSPAIAPGETGTLRLELPANWREADVLALRIEDPRGREVWTYTWPLPGVQRFAQLSETTPASGVRAVTIGDAGALDFDDVARGVRLRSAGGAAELVASNMREENGDRIVTQRYTGGLKTVEWRLRANGWVDCTYEVAGVKGATFQGVSLDVSDVEVRGKSWVGNGPYRVWQNRQRGVIFGAWANAYNDTITGWRGFAYPEFKGVFSDVRWLTLETSAGRLTVVPKTAGLYVQVMKLDEPPAELVAKTAVALPDGTLSLLHVIPAIGTKFTRPEEGGPQGIAPAAQDTYRGSFSLRWEK